MAGEAPNLILAVHDHAQDAASELEARAQAMLAEASELLREAGTIRAMNQLAAAHNGHGTKGDGQ